MADPVVEATEPEPGKARGYDDPAKIDILDRRPFARSIADVISNTPPDFGVRVGVFGEWGSGKTSVLNFLREMLEARNHIVVDFSPWGVVDPTELWTLLAQSLSEQLRSKGQQKGTWFERFVLEHNDQVKAGARMAKGIADKFGLGAAVDEVKGLLTRTEKQVRALAKGNERIVVMIDDVDRTDPRLVPPILFGLRALFDVPRFSWILAIDPVVVRAALKQHHPGFGLGRDFLEKIVDFPFTLRGPEPSRRAALLERDLAETEVRLDGVTFSEIEDMLPANPRELRAIVRHFRTIAGTLARLAQDEVDQRLLLTLVVIHAAAPNLLAGLLDSATILRKLTGLKLISTDRDRWKKERAVARKEINGLLVRSDIRKEERPRLRALLLRIGEGGYWAPETVVAAGSLLHTRPVVTARETDESIAAATDPSSLQQWIEQFSVKQDRTPIDVRRALFEQLLKKHDRTMDEAIGSGSSDEMEHKVRTVLAIVKMLEMAIFGIGAAAEFKAEQLEQLRSAFSKWAHFVHPPDYGPARQSERELLLRFAAYSELDPLTALDRVKPVRDRGLNDDEGDQARLSLNLGLLSALEERAAGKFIEMLDKENLVFFFGHWRRAGTYLLRGDGQIWTAKFRDQLRGALEGDRSVARAENAKELLRSAIKLLPAARSTIFADADLIGLLWKAMTAVAPNMRMFESVERLRREVEEATSQPLPEPPWWGPKREQYELAKRRREAAEQPVRNGEEDVGGK